MKNQKNKIRGILAITVSIATAFSMCMLSGCDGKNKETEGVVISVGDWPAKEGADLDSTNAKKEKFEAENVGVTVKGDTWTFDLQTFYPKAAAGLLPNVYKSYYSEITNLIDTGYLADITKKTKELGIYDKLNPTVRDIAVKDGKLYALPTDTYGLGLAANVDMLKAAGYVDENELPHQPKDWVELAEMAKKIKEVTGKPGLVLPTAGNSGGWFFTNIGWSFGVNFVVKDGEKWVSGFDTEECVQALEYVKDLKWKYDVLPEQVVINGSDYYEIFATGGAAITVGNSGTPGSILKYEMNKDSQAYLAIPAGPKGRYSLVGGMLYCISSESDENQIEACLKWINPGSLTESSKAGYENYMKERIDKGMLMGLKKLPSFTNKAPYEEFTSQFTIENMNVNENHIKHYNDSLSDPSIVFRAEEPICAQDLYSILDSCIQQVLQDENADCKAIIKEASQNFQTQYLDQLEQ